MLKIKAVFKTSEGEVYDSHNEALIAEALDQSEIFIESYRKRQIIESLSTLLDVMVKADETN